MLRKNKNTDIAPKTEERGLQRHSDARNPITWLEEMDDWFDEFRRGFEERFLNPLSPWTEARRARPSQTLVDLTDEGQGFLFQVELPGVAKEDVDLHVTPDGIEVTAEARRENAVEHEGYYRWERSHETFHRAMPFPAQARPERAEASLKDGVLEVRVPKKGPTMKEERVKVRVQ